MCKNQKMIERNYSIDILKFICAILVVFLHTDCVYHDYILPLTRCAVPCFFMISGYLLFNDGDIEISRLKRSTRNILHIIVCLRCCLLVIKKLWQYIKGVFTYHHFVNYLIL